MTLHCRHCNYEWFVPLKVPMSINRFLKASEGIVAAGCPKCGAHGENVLCGRARRPDGHLGASEQIFSPYRGL